MRYYATEAAPEEFSAAPEDQNARLEWEGQADEAPTADSYDAADSSREDTPLYGRALYMYRIEHGGRNPGEKATVSDGGREDEIRIRPGLFPEELGGIHPDLTGRELYMARIMNGGKANGRRSPKPDPQPPEGLHGRDLMLWRLQNQRLAGASWSAGAGDDK